MKSHVNGEADFVLSQTVIFESPILDDLVDINHFWLILINGWDTGGVLLVDKSPPAQKVSSDVK